MNGTRELANLNVSLQNNVHIAEAIQVCFKIGYIPSCADFFSILPMKIDQKTGVLLSSNIAMENDPDPQIAHLTGEHRHGSVLVYQIFWPMFQTPKSLAKKSPHDLPMVR